MVWRRGRGISMSFHSTKSSRRWYRAGACARASASGVEPSEAAAARNLAIAATISACPPPGPLLWRARQLPRGGCEAIELDDLHRELPRGEEVRRGAVAGGVLEAEVEEGEEDGVLIGGGEAALVEELEDALGEGEGGVGVGVEEQRGILGGGAEEVSSSRGGGVRCGGHGSEMTCPSTLPC